MSALWCILLLSLNVCSINGRGWPSNTHYIPGKGQYGCRVYIDGGSYHYCWKTCSAWLTISGTTQYCYTSTYCGDKNVTAPETCAGVFDEECWGKCWSDEEAGLLGFIIGYAGVALSGGFAGK